MIDRPKYVDQIMRYVDLYVTGSNSRMMSSEIATYLTGRYVAFRIFTLSFAEYLTFKEQYAPLEDHRIELANYIRLGGFPATHLRAYGESEVYTIIRDIYNSTIFSDIVKRNQIRKIDQLERVVKYAFQNVGNTFSAKSISDYLKAEHRSLDHETVYSYLEKLEAAYLLHRCPRYDLKGKDLPRRHRIAIQRIGLPSRYRSCSFGECGVSGTLPPWIYGLHWQTRRWRDRLCGDPTEP